MNHRARTIKSLARRKGKSAPAEKTELREKEVYGAESRAEVARRADPGYEQYSVWGPRVPMVIGFRPNDER